jgi:hypothetical protein
MNTKDSNFLLVKLKILKKSKKLTVEQVFDIKYNLRAKDAMLKYPFVSQTTITRIRTKKIWKSV